MTNSEIVTNKIGMSQAPGGRRCPYLYWPRITKKGGIEKKNPKDLERCTPKKRGEEGEAL